MLILRIDIAIARLKIYLLNRLSFLPPSIKTEYSKKICNDIVGITNEMKLRKIL